MLLARWRSTWILFLALGTGLDAATFTVTKEDDTDGTCEPADCSLREAVLAANASPGFDVIEVPGGTYPLPLGGPTLLANIRIVDDVDIQGDESLPVVIDGVGVNRVFFIDESTVTLSNLTITGGVRPSGGSGIRASLSDVTLVNCRITGNHATQTDGGGIMTNIGDMTLINTAVYGNTANDFGGGFSVTGVDPQDPAQLTLINSTISNNIAGRIGGAIYMIFDVDLTIINSTIAHNEAPLASAVFYALSPRSTWTNSIVVGDCGFLQGLAPISNGGNVESPGESCHLRHAEDLRNVTDVGLAPLGDYGGPTPTHALYDTSPALDAALAIDCPDTDQRGVARPLDGDYDGEARCDAGAYESDVFLRDPLSIPTLAPPGLVALALSIVVAASVVLRRRRRAVRSTAAPEV